MLIDFADLSMTPVRLPPEMDVIVAHSGVYRSLDRTAYAERRSECEAASYRLGDLGKVDLPTVMALPDPLLRKRARHVVTECQRVRQFVASLRTGDLVTAGDLMTESHRSLALDFEVSTPQLDLLAEKLRDIPGVFGARLTGAGFGGCVVAISEPDAVEIEALGVKAWRVRASGGARLIEADRG
jgi:galactokinase